jgi:hypothetical protein
VIFLDDYYSQFCRPFLLIGATTHSFIALIFKEEDCKVIGIEEPIGPPIEASSIDRTQQNRFHLRTRDEPSLETLWFKKHKDDG